MGAFAALAALGFTGAFAGVGVGLGLGAAPLLSF